MRTPLRIADEVLMEAADEYIREVRRIQRAEMRAVITKRCEADESPVLTADEIEMYVDILEALVQVAGYDRDKINQVIEERIVKAAPQVTDDAILDQYHFTVTGRISTRCKNCRRDHRWTEQQFRQDRFLQRILIGDPATCPYCHTGQLKVHGVIAVRDALDSSPLALEACTTPTESPSALERNPQDA